MGSGARVAILVGILVAGCKPVEAVPLDLDEAIRRMWTDPFSDELGPVFDAFDREIDEAGLLEAPLEGELSRLSPEEAFVVDIEEREGALPDPSLARGLLFLNRFACDADAFETLLTHADQNVIYDTYDGYTRTFTGDRDAWRSGATDTLDWTGEIIASIPAIGQYTYGFVTELRRFTVPEPHPSAGATAWVTRNFMPSPAVWKDEDKSMPQDYQLEVFFPWEGEILHVYGFWREMNLGGSLTMESEFVARITLDQLRKWDATTARVCDEGVPPE